MLCVLVIISCLVLTPTASSGVQYSITITSQVSIQYTDRNPIVILSDEDFAIYALPGNGSLQNPYRIEGLRIESDQTCIHIENCSKSFTVSNCKLWLRKDGNSVYVDEGYRHAILLKNTTSSTVENTIVELDQFTTDSRISAVHLENCTDIRVQNILGRKSIGPFYPYSFHMGEIRGVASYNCLSCNVSDSVFLHLTVGIKLVDSMYFQLTNNSVIDETQSGIHLMSSSFNSIINNSLDTYLIGVLLDSGNNNSIFGNCFRSFAGELAWDAGSSNLWHDNVSIGNGWSDFSGTGIYEIEGPAESVDQYPWICSDIQVDVQDRFGPDIVYYNKPSMTTAAAALGPITQLYLYAEAFDDTGVDCVFGIYRMEGSSVEVEILLNMTSADTYQDYTQINPVDPYHVEVHIKYWANDSLGNWRQTPEVLWSIHHSRYPFYIPSEDLLLGAGLATVVLLVAGLYLGRKYLDRKQLQDMLG